MSSDIAAADWQCVGVAQAGGAVGLAGEIACFEFRSQAADFRGKYLFVGAGLGLGGSLGGGVAPSPDDFLDNNVADLWSPLEILRPFSADDLELAYASVATLGAAAAYGYTLLSISGGWMDPLFRGDVSGWGTGVGIAGAMLVGVWKLIGGSAYY